MDNIHAKSTKKIVLNGVMAALVFLATFFTRIPGPVPPGYINFGDAVIMITAILLGKSSGFIAGAFGSALADVAAPGGLLFAPITFIVKGIEGYVIGAIARSRTTDEKHANGAAIQASEVSEDSHKNKSPGYYEVRKVIAVIAGALIMVAGYFIAELSILKLFDSTFGYTAAISELPFNFIQGGVSVVLGYVLSSLLEKAGVHRLLEV
ncbi:MAG TPA: ECF transporter S component [Clostridiales bacterium]|nr:ECF transporter S component [Clostridiales bacterium]